MTTFNFPASPIDFTTGTELTVQGQFNFTPGPYGIPVISPTAQAISTNTTMVSTGTRHVSYPFAQITPRAWVVLTSGAIRPSVGEIYPRGVK